MNRRDRRAQRDPVRDRQLSDRLHMLRHNESAVHLMLAKLAAEDNEHDIVAAIIDTRDELGRDLARHMGVAGEAERLAGPNRIPTILATVGRLDAAAAFANTHPKISAGLEITPPPTHVPTVIIGAGGMSLVYVERISLLPIGEA